MWLIIAILFSILGLFGKSVALLFMAALFLAWFFISLFEKEEEAMEHAKNMLIFLWEAYWWIMAQVEKLIVFLWGLYKKAFKGGYGKGWKWFVWALTWYFFSWVFMKIGLYFPGNLLAAKIGLVGGFMFYGPFFVLAFFILGVVGWQMITGSPATEKEGKAAKKKGRKARA